MNVSVSDISRLQADAGRIRNICILAHVDHGKTTLSDNLIASNGLIHPKMVGKLRYLDSREDEQSRCITMKSSSISLVYAPGSSHNKSSAEEAVVKTGHLINLIDSPGHIDFCSEVSTAVRLSDGCLVVVDTCEGVCIQTHAVLRQAWEEKLEPCLVFNKLDRLILELQLSPEETYSRLKTMLAEINTIISTFESERYLSEADAVLAHAEVAAAGGAGEGEDGEGEEGDFEEDTGAGADMFSIEKGNVAFASGWDGWAFQVDQFASMYAAKLGCKEASLKRALWGDYYLQPKTKKIVGKKASGGKLKPLFVQLALEPLWKAYGVLAGGHQEALTKMASALHIAVAPRDLGHGDPRVALSAFMKAWLPLAETVLGMAVRCLPSPRESSRTRVERLVPQPKLLAALPASDVLAAGRASLEGCDPSPGAPTVVFVSKMVAVPAAAIPRGADGELPAAARQALAAGADGHVFLGFGRVFSGTLTPGQRMHVLSGLYDPSVPQQHRQTAVVSGVYLMMGQGLEPLPRVPAGNVCAVLGLETSVLKSATLASTPVCRPFGLLSFQAAAIVRVAVEPVDPVDMPRLVEGLRLLNRADPLVEVVVQESGEHVLAAAGEVHLETCVKDLRERFARVDLQVSAPLVAFKESVVDPRDAPSEGPGAATAAQVAGATCAQLTTPNGMCTLRVRALPMPAQIAALLESQGGLLKRALGAGAKAGAGPGGAAAAQAAGAGGDEAADLRERLLAILDEAEKDGLAWGAQWRGILHSAWMFGAKRVGPNVLFSSPGEWAGPEAAGAAGEEAVGEAPPSRHVPLGAPAAAQALGLVSREGGGGVTAEGGGEEKVEGAATWTQVHSCVQSGVATGFQLACEKGPLCDEPLWGTAMEVAAVVHSPAGGHVDLEQLSTLSGQVISTAREACRKAVLAAGARLVEAMYLCETSTTAEALGNAYSILGRRRSRIMREELREGSGLFSVHAYLPAAASFGFADELRRSTSGAASASLLLSHWERIQVDPFYAPKTQDEREEFGEEGQGLGGNSFARKLVDTVRRRKGLHVQEKVVKEASKQRTKARKV